MLGVIGDGANILIARRKIDAFEATRVRDRACLAQLAPDRRRIFNPARIEMVKIGCPVGNRCAVIILVF